MLLLNFSLFPTEQSEKLLRWSSLACALDDTFNPGVGGYNYFYKCSKNYILNRIISLQYTCTNQQNAMKVSRSSIKL